MYLSGTAMPGRSCARDGRHVFDIVADDRTFRYCSTDRLGGVVDHAERVRAIQLSKAAFRAAWICLCHAVSTRSPYALATSCSIDPLYALYGARAACTVRGCPSVGNAAAPAR